MLLKVTEQALLCPRFFRRLFETLEIPYYQRQTQDMKFECPNCKRKEV